MKRETVLQPGTQRWLITFVSILISLVAIFALILSVSAVDFQKWRDIASSLTDTPIVFGEAGAASADFSQLMPADSDASTARFESASEWELLYYSLMEQMGNSESTVGLNVSVTDDAISISLSDQILFDSGQAEIKPSGKAVLAGLGGRIRDNSAAIAEIRIEGHTDNRPISNVRFEDNWALSLGRSISVLKFYLNESKLGIGGDKFAAIGYADMRPLESNDTEEGRARNRRVDIVLIRGDGSTITGSQR